MKASAAILAAVLALALGAVPAEASVLPGWPRPSATGVVERGPQGGVVTMVTGRFQIVVTAYRADGTRRWRVSRRFCETCGGLSVDAPRLQADGTYGPLRAAGFWAVDQRGRVLPGCASLVSRDGTCVAGRLAIWPTSDAVTATRAGATLWEYREPGVYWDLSAPAPVFRDLAGGPAYAAFPTGADTTVPGWSSTDQTAPSRTLAIDPATGTLLWRRLGLYPVAALSGGVLVRAASEGAAPLIALDAAGRERWTSAATGRGLPLYGDNDSVETSGIVVDERRGRVYAAQGDGSVAALDAATGAVRWSVGPEASVPSLTGAGLILTSVWRPPGRSAAPSYTLRAIGSDGRTRWSYPLAWSYRPGDDASYANPATSVRELRDGTVAIVSGGLLTRIDPRGHERPPRAASFSLSRRVIPTMCERDGAPAICTDADPSAGAILRIRLPRASRVEARLAGSPTRTVLDAPAGTSYLRLAVETYDARPGRSAIVVTWHEKGQTRARALPVVVAPR